MNTIKRARSIAATLLVLAGSLANIQCGGGSASAGGGSLPPSTPDITGDWEATFNSSVFNASGKVYGYFSQSGNLTTANLHIDGSPCLTTGASTGSISENSVTFTLVQGVQTATFTGTIGSSGDSMSGTYSVSGGCANGDRGTWSAAIIPSGQCVSAPIGLVSWWRGEGNGNDQAGLNDAEIQGGVSFVTGEVGQAFAFDGSTGYLNVPDSPSLENISTAESVELWVKPEAGSGATTQFLYSRRNPFLSESFSVYSLTTGAIGMIVKTTTSPTNTGSKFETAPGVLNQGQFQHIAAAADTAIGSAAVYLDGQQIPVTAVYGPSTFGGTFASVPYLWIARREDIDAGEGVDGAGYFSGDLDEITLYSVALDQAQVQFIFHAGSGGKCP